MKIHSAICENCSSLNLYRDPIKKTPAGGTMLDCNNCGKISYNIHLQTIEV